MIEYDGTDAEKDLYEAETVLLSNENDNSDIISSHSENEPNIKSKHDGCAKTYNLSATYIQNKSDTLESNHRNNSIADSLSDGSFEFFMKKTRKHCNIIESDIDESDNMSAPHNANKTGLHVHGNSESHSASQNSQNVISESGVEESSESDDHISKEANTPRAVKPIILSHFPSPTNSCRNEDIIDASIEDEIISMTAAKISVNKIQKQTTFLKKDLPTVESNHRNNSIADSLSDGSFEFFMKETRKHCNIIESDIDESDNMSAPHNANKTGLHVHGNSESHSASQNSQNVISESGVEESSESDDHISKEANTPRAVKPIILSHFPSPTNSCRNEDIIDASIEDEIISMTAAKISVNKIQKQTTFLKKDLPTVESNHRNNSIADSLSDGSFEFFMKETRKHCNIIESDIDESDNMSAPHNANKIGLHVHGNSESHSASQNSQNVISESGVEESSESDDHISKEANTPRAVKPIILSHSASPTNSCSDEDIIYASSEDEYISKTAAKTSNIYRYWRRGSSRTERGGERRTEFL